MHRSKLHFPTILSTILCIVSLSLSAEIDPNIGKTLFRDNCASCHNRDMKTVLTGPALGPAEDQWADFSRQELYGWVRNAPLMISDGHPRAVDLWNQFKPTAMTAFPNLTDDEIESIFAYVRQEYTKAPVAAAGPVGQGSSGSDESSNTLLYIILLIVLGALAMVLARVISNLNQITQVQEGKVAEEPRTVLQLLTSRQVVSFVIFVLVVFGGYTTVNNAIAFGRQQGYAPEQPIKFSHAIHSGIQGIDCQYCHDGARRSKHSVIPAASTCMNCHRAVTVGSQYGTGEITKIYASIGFNPSKNAYIDDYDSMPEDSIKAIYQKWITDQYLLKSGKGALDRRGEMEVEEQWKGIKTSLTNPQKPNIPGPIEWTRIHHLPDHVYFSHEQHVTVGKVTCQQCHGKVEEMETLSQYAPLSMGWCINCHRETDVQFAGNPYYESYKKYHDGLASGKRTSVTVEDIGGLECQKCHY
jgi:mono/diheme cytochrome c family protein